MADCGFIMHGWRDGKGAWTTDCRGAHHPPAPTPTPPPAPSSTCVGRPGEPRKSRLATIDRKYGQVIGVSEIFGCQNASKSRLKSKQVVTFDWAQFQCMPSATRLLQNCPATPTTNRAALAAAKQTKRRSKCTVDFSTPRRGVQD